MQYAKSNPFHRSIAKALHDYYHEKARRIYDGDPSALDTEARERLVTYIDKSVDFAMRLYTIEGEEEERIEERVEGVLSTYR